MTNYSISFKIKDYNPKINSISYKDYICLLINGGFQIRIPIINEEYSNIKHEVKNIKSDLYYKITLLDNKIKTFISISDFCIPYKILLKIKQDSPFIYEKEIKFSIGMKKNFKVFSSLNKIGNISLIISTKILKNPKKIANKNKPDLIRNYLVKGNILPISFTQRNQKNRNLLKNKVEIKKKNKNKEKDDFFYSDSNRHISTNDLSGNHFNTFSMNDDTENNNTNNSIANIVSHKNYYFNTTLGNEETKKLNNINVIDNGNENGNLFEYKLKNANIDNEVSNLLEKRKNIRKKFYFSKGIFIKNKLSQNITQNIMKNKIKNENKKKKKY